VLLDAYNKMYGECEDLRPRRGQPRAGRLGHLRGHVIGRVTWSAPYVGDALAYIAEKFMWILVILAAVVTVAALMMGGTANPRALR